MAVEEDDDEDEEKEQEQQEQEEGFDDGDKVPMSNLTTRISCCCPLKAWGRCR